MKTLTQKHFKLPGWLDQALFDQWTEGGQVLFSKEQDGRFWVVVEFRYEESERHVLQLHRYFNIGDQTMISCDVDAKSEAEHSAFLVKVLEAILR